MKNLLSVQGVNLPKPRVFGTSITNIPEHLSLQPKDEKASKGFSLENQLSFLLKAKDPDCLSDYNEDIAESMYENEGANKANFGYMQLQPDVTEKMREILLDWLVEVHWRFKLLPETLHLTVNLIDRYLEKTVILRNRLQLVGIAAMVVACKCEEVHPPELKDFAFVTDNTYSQKQIAHMEYRLLKALSFRASTVTSYRCLQVIVKQFGVEEMRVKVMAQYVVEACLMRYEMLKHKASLVAHAALCLSLRMISKDREWDKHKPKYKEQQLEPLMHDIVSLFQTADNQLRSLKHKYSQPEFLRIALNN
eukprot:TRINITY_DN14334_c0_g2_i2.p1 TRINITY_DN14334_c0_g2~~TRINITY_DN14334_c0_g2_i2.p1  ORF type:complete len:342 (+),score=44.04 TRINITY_DN14334_c0_g2_i2:108-1028(+)